MQAPAAIRRSRDRIVTEDIPAGVIVGRSSCRIANDDVLREDHRAPHDLPFPRAVLALQAKQVIARTITRAQYRPGTIRQRTLWQYASQSRPYLARHIR